MYWSNREAQDFILFENIVCPDVSPRMRHEAIVSGFSCSKPSQMLDFDCREIRELMLAQKNIH